MRVAAKRDGHGVCDRGRSGTARHTAEQRRPGSLPTLRLRGAALYAASLSKLLLGNCSPHKTRNDNA